MTHNETKVFEILICSAWLPEQRCLRQLLGSGPALEDSVPGSRPLWSSELHDSELSFLQRAKTKFRFNLRNVRYEFLMCGVGSFAAQEALLLHLAQATHLPDLVCFVGTAGLIGQTPIAFEAPFAVKLCRSCWFDASLAEGAAYLPAGSQAELGLSAVRENETKERSLGTLPDVLGASANSWICASATGITRKILPAYSAIAQFENLELYGFARACKSFALPWLGYLGVSNIVGPNAHEQWKRYHLAASCMAQELFLQNHGALN